MVKRDRNHPSVIMWSIGNEIHESLGSPDGAARCSRIANFVRSLDDSRFVTSAIPVNFFEILEAGEFNPLLNPGPVPGNPQKDIWGNMTRDFSQHLDVVGYNYLPRRYEADGTRFPDRVLAGTETFPHRAFYYWKETERLPHVIGDFVWTAFDYLGEAGLGSVTFEGSPAFSAPYPYHLANCGDFDICGFKRPQSYYRDLLWCIRTAPFIGVHDPKHHGKRLGISPWAWEPVIDSWTFPGQEGNPTRVDVYAIDDEVELLINGVSVGRKQAGLANRNMATFEVNYQPGTIEAVGYRNGKETERIGLKTASSPAAMKLIADRTELKAEYGDLAYVTIEVLDKDGVMVKHVEPIISLDISGVAELIAVGTGNPISEELYIGSQRKAYQGRLMAVVRTSGQVGKITLMAKAEGMPTAQIELQAE